MESNDYIYAVARIRFREAQCLSGAVIESLLAAKSEDECLRLLADRGWGEQGADADTLLKSQQKQTWATLRELVGEEGMTAFDLFLLPNDCHNLKAAVKQIISPAEDADVFIPECTVAPSVLSRAVRNADFDALPEYMREPARAAMAALQETRDGQLCDIIIDAALIGALTKAGDDSVAGRWATLQALCAAVKTAVRAGATGKDRAFLERALPDALPVDRDGLITAALGGRDEITAFLAKAGYDGGAQALEDSVAAFEKWCDDALTAHMRPQKHNVTGIDPLSAWLIARQGEMRTVRVILSGKRNGLSGQLIRERVREMYV